MRLLFFVVVLIAIGWGAYRALFEKKGVLGTYGVPAIEKGFRAALPVAPVGPSATGQPGSSPEAPGKQTMAATVIPTPADSKAVEVPATAPAPVPVTVLYAFQYREPPPVADMGLAGVKDMIVTSDKLSRVMAFHGPPESVDLALAFCKAIDQLPGSCAVQTWAVYVDRSVQTGFDLVAALRGITPGVNAMSAGDGAFTLNITAGEVSLVLDAIADGSAVEVVQRPHVRLSHGITSKIDSISEIPIPTANVSNGISQSSVEFRKVGLQLEVTPYFLSHDAVRLAVSQSNGIVGDNVEIQGSAIPVIQSQTVSTSADMTIGQTIILGGVTTQRVRTVRGLLRNTKETTEGALYVILSTYHEEPKAVRVGSPVLEFPPAMGAAPFTVPMDNPGDWIDSGLLPVKGWQAEEKKFLRVRSAK